MLAKKVKTLSELSASTVSKIPKFFLNIIYADMVWPEKMKSWASDIENVQDQELLMRTRELEQQWLDESCSFREDSLDPSNDSRNCGPNVSVYGYNSFFRTRRISYEIKWRHRQR